MDDSDNLLTGTYYLCFSIWDNAAVGMGSQQWPSGTPNPTQITTSNGVFSAEIGSADTLDLDFDAYDYYLQIYVNDTSSCTSGGETLSPRQHITSAAYSINADMLDGLDAESSGADAHIVSTDSSGNLISSAQVQVGSYASAPTALGVGALYYNSTDGNIYVWDGIGSAWVDLTGGGSLYWQLSANVLNPTDSTYDFAIGGTTLAASMFGLDESAGNFYFGYDNSANPTFLFEATDGDAGTFGFNMNDAFYFSDAYVGVGLNNPAYTVEIAETSTETIGGPRATLKNTRTVAPASGSSTTNRAFWSTVTVPGTTTVGINEVAASYIETSYSGTGGVSTVKGQDLLVGVYSGAGTVINLYATTSNPYTQSSTTISGNAYSFFTDPSYNGTVANHVSYYSDSSSATNDWGAYLKNSKNYLSGKLGVGAEPTWKFHVEESNTATTGTMIGSYTLVTADPPSASSQTSFGNYVQIRNDPSNNNNITGSHAMYRGTADWYGTGTLSGGLYGFWPSVANRNTGTVSSAVGLYGLVTNLSTGTITDARGLRVDITNPGGGTISTAYGVLVASVQATSSGYGVYISTVTGSANAWGVYQVNAANPNYFAGDTGIGTITPEAKLQVTGGGLCVGSDANCNSDNDTQGVVYSSSTAMTVYDVAEMYPAIDTTLKPGELVSLNQERGVFVERANVNNSNKIIGIVSTEPGVLLGGFAGKQFINEHQIPVALSGRVPTNVSTENGSIKIGDKLCASKIPGVAAKAVGAGQIAGIALEDYSGEGIGQIQVFVNLSWYEPESYLAKIDELIKSHEDDSLTGNISSIPSDLVINSIKAQTGIFSQISGSELSIGNGRLKIDALGNVESAGTITTKKLAANSIEASRLFAETEKDLTINLSKGKNLKIKNNNGDTILTITENGKFAYSAQNSSSPIGEGVLPAGNFEVFVENILTTQDSKIFVTPNIPINQGIAVTEKVAGRGFKVSIRTKEEIDIIFDYWIVN